MDILTEGKWKIKGKYLAVDGGYTSIPGAYDNDAVVISIKNDKELVNWLNKEKAKYQGIDKR